MTVPKASPILENFNAGEMSPMIGGRVSYEKYPNGASIMENFIPTTQGPIVRRGGTRFVYSAYSNTEKSLLVPFEYSVNQAYVIEFSDEVIRFFTWDAVTKERGIITDNMGDPYELASPYKSSDLFRADGTPAISYAQSGDYLYIAHPNIRPKIVRRLTATTFEIVDFNFKGGPWQILNDNEALTVYASAQTGTVTLTASDDIFELGHVGAYFLLETKSINDIPAWEVSKSIQAGDLRRSDGKTYKALTTGTTGTIRPVHTSGALYDGDAGSVQWEYQDPWYGYVKITGYTDAKTVTAEVIDLLPDGVVGSGNTTHRWAFGEWSDVAGWPSHVAFFRERLWFGRGQTVWGSVSADFEDFSDRSFGEVTADMAITVSLASGKINALQWLAASSDLVVGTAGGEFVISELTNGEPLGPQNKRCRLVSQFGSRAIQPIANAESLLFITRSGLRARETFYDYSTDGYKSTDCTVLADHITASGIVQMAFAPEPDPVVWCVRADGALIGFTWNNEQNVRGWHRHPTLGRVESIAVIPAAEGDRSELWLSVVREVNGQEVRYIEYMTRPYRPGDSQADQFYVDCGLVYSGAQTTTITGLDHLEGCEVAVLADGASHPNRVVDGGEIELQLPASKVAVGLPMVSRYRSMRIEAGAADGTAQGKTKRVHKAVMRFLYTGSGKFGTLKDGDPLDELHLRNSADLMDQAVPLFSGDAVVSWPKGYDQEAYIGFMVDQPIAATLVAVMPQLVTQDAR